MTDSRAAGSGSGPAGPTPGFVDPELEPVLARVPVDDEPGLGDVGALRAFVAGSPASLSEPEDDGRVARVDHEVPGLDGAPAVSVRCYRPRGSQASPPPLPVLVWAHGGGFVAGDLAGADRRCADWCEQLGVVVVSVAYRLAPEDPYPAALDDVDAVRHWVAQAAGDLGVDPARLAVGGSSAGATLAAGLALRARERGGPGIALQVLLQPALDDRCATVSSRWARDARVLDRRAQQDMWRLYLGPDADRVPAEAAPARAEELARLPRAVIQTCEHDPLRDEGLDHALRLQRAGVPTELLHLPGTFHGFEELAPGSAVARRARRHLLAAVGAALAVGAGPHA